ncbi:MAG: hypothetical protein C5B50_15540 [Verrucomicrobia bacterium]|nr:MAG: hypothetical protein C5B50_15540 [Verrucomicrobiota bacterium]
MHLQRSIGAKLLLFWLFSAVAALAESGRPDLILPGTQPMEHAFAFRPVANCKLCHAGTTNGLADPFLSWQGSMMGQAARDPVFRAALAVANQDLPGSGEYCIRCHSPRAWLEGRSTAPDASALKEDDLNGVSCDVCHHLVDPLSEEAKKLAKDVPPGRGDGMMVVDTERSQRGPYDEPKGMKMHGIRQSAYQGSSELCGTCHNVSNPTLATNVALQPPHAFGHIERTYSEWALSDFATKGNLRSCQSCHFAPVPGGGMAMKRASNYGDGHRDYFVSHNAVGGSTWVQDAVYRLWSHRDLDRAALDAGKEHAREFLKTAAALGVQAREGKVLVTITNLTGHKLPTGYPEGRRMWLNVRFLDKDSSVIYEYGAYGETNALLSGTQVQVPTLLDPTTTRVYECKPGISQSRCAKFQQSPGPSFHFILNDLITKDNRIPPRGFRNVAFAEHLAAPIGATYADGQYWDVVEFPFPKEIKDPARPVVRVEVRLMYQSVSWEYLKFLVEQNHTDSWGKKLYEAWTATGKCAPSEMAVSARRLGGD